MPKLTAALLLLARSCLHLSFLSPVLVRGFVINSSGSTSMFANKRPRQVLSNKPRSETAIRLRTDWNPSSPLQRSFGQLLPPQPCCPSFCREQKRKLYSSTDADTSSADADYVHVKSDWEEDDDAGSGDDEAEASADDQDEMIVQEQNLAPDDQQLGPEYKLWLQAIQTAQNALTKKQTSLENESSKAQTVEDTVARAQLIVNNLYLFNNSNDHPKQQQPQVYTVVDWDKDGEEIELTLDSQKYDSPSAEADALFAQARKLKRGSQVVRGLLEEVQQAMRVLVDCQDHLAGADGTDEGKLRLVQNRLRRTSSSTKFKEPRDFSDSANIDDKRNSSTSKRQQSNDSNKKKPALGSPASNVRKLLTPNGATVLVGRNRRGNEHISLALARGNDVWMHARGTPGAHVLLLDRRGSVRPTDDCLAFAADLAAFYSDGRTEVKVAVTVAEPKHVQKPRGAPLGAVKLRQEGQVIYGAPGRVPEELHQARAQAGVYATEEYRSADKAKHRKRTQHVQKQKLKQKREQRKQKRRANYDTGDDPYASV